MNYLPGREINLSELNAEADEKALRHLVGLVGNDVRRLTNELEKLATASLPDSLITYDLVESLVANSREMDNFGLTDHLMDKNKKQILAYIKENSR